MRHIVLDELHITISVSPKLPDKECLHIRRTLKSRGFRMRLDRSVQQVLRRYSALRPVRAVISQ